MSLAADPDFDFDGEADVKHTPKTANPLHQAELWRRRLGDCPAGQGSTSESSWVVAEGDMHEEPRVAAVCGGYPGGDEPVVAFVAEGDMRVAPRRRRSTPHARHLQRRTMR